MYKQNLRELVEFDENKFLAKVLVNEPGYRMVLLNFRSGQGMPEHSAKEMVTVYVLSGHITFYENQAPTELRAGEVLWIKEGVLHRLEAHESSSLLVIRAGTTAPARNEEEIDVRLIPRPQRHPMIFKKFDALGVGKSFLLVNDHDPVPSNRQMESMRPGQLAWEYLVRGPDLFRIRIRRTAPPSGSETSPNPGNLVTGIGPGL